MKRKANAIWEGSGKEGKGHLSTQSTVLNKTQYSFSSRFAEGVGTNPEELVAAAHAGCFTMKLSLNIDGAGFTADKIETDCTILMEGLAITESHLDVKATIKGIGKDKFEELVKEAEENCPISKLLNTKITVTSTLNG